MASEFPVEGDKVKKLVKKSRTMPIPFGFNAGTADEDDEYLAAHARKAPEVLGKIAVAEGAGTKSAYGTFAISDSEIHLTCFRTIPQLAKKFKLFLKRFKVHLNVVVTDPDGNVLDSDVEVLKDWFREEGDDGEEDVADAPGESGVTTEAEAMASGIDVADLTDRLRALHPKVAAAPPEVAPRVAAAFKAAVGLIRDGRFEQASITIAQLQAVMARLATVARPAPKAKAQPKVPPQPQPRPQPQPQAKAPPPADPRLPGMRAAVDTLSRQAAEVLGNGAARYLDALEAIEDLIDAGNADRAMRGLAKVQEAVAVTREAREKWEKVRVILEPLVAKAMDGGVTDRDVLRSRWRRATDLDAAGEYARALTTAPDIVQMLRQAQR